MSETTTAQDWLPRPDPTKLTTEQLTREILSLKEQISIRLDAMDKAQDLVQADLARVPTETERVVSHLRELHDSRFKSYEEEIAALRAILETRFAGMDRAIILLQSIFDKLPLRIDEKIVALRDVQEEKFISIQQQFRERDVRTEQSSKDSKVAIDAALLAAKELVGKQNESSSSSIAKSETATFKQIDNIMELIRTGNSAANDKIDDVKDRLTRLEGRGEAKVEQTQRNDHTVGLMVAIGLALLSVIVTVGMAMIHYATGK